MYKYLALFIFTFFVSTSLFSVANKKVIQLKTGDGIFSPVPSVKKAPNEETFQYNQFIVYKNPSLQPPVLSRGFIVEDAIPILYTTYSEQSFSSQLEILFLYHSNLSFQDLVTYYEAFFKDKDLRVLQKQNTKAGVVFLTETATKRTITIQVEDKTTYRKVRLYYKNQIY
jgi:hypothetical protein